MQKLHPCLWTTSNENTQGAAELYTTLFGGRITETTRMPDGSILTMHINIFGQDVMLLNGGPQFRFNEAVSLYVETEDQAETDRYWNALIADGGEESMCGWLKDRYGLSWQIIPKQLQQCLGGSDKAGANRAMQAMLKMHKIVVADLEKAYAGA
jgi:predicted 3-demethylubiquinone-9 3-methyltransferase (glyoxalase superfamily)